MALTSRSTPGGDPGTRLGRRRTWIILASYLILIFDWVKVWIGYIVGMIHPPSGTSIVQAQLLLPYPSEGHFALLLEVTWSLFALAFLLIVRRGHTSNSRPARRRSPRRYLTIFIVGFTGPTAMYIIGQGAWTFYRALFPQTPDWFSHFPLEPGVNTMGYWGTFNSDINALQTAVIGSLEEILLVALVVTIARRFGLSVAWPIVISVLFRYLHHLHQGPVGSLIFVGLWSLCAVVFYLKTNALFPLWLAHFVNNFAVSYNYSDYQDGAWGPAFARWWTENIYIYIMVCGLVILLLVLTRGVAATSPDSTWSRDSGPRTELRTGGTETHETDQEPIPGQSPPSDSLPAAEKGR